MNITVKDLQILCIDSLKNAIKKNISNNLKIDVVKEIIQSYEKTREMVVEYNNKDSERSMLE